MRLPSLFAVFCWTVVLNFNSAAVAQIVDFNVTPVTVNGGANASFGNINIAAGTFDTTGAGLSFTFQAGEDFFAPYVWMAGGPSLNLTTTPGGFLTKLTSSDVIDGSWAHWTSGYTNPVLFSGAEGPWVGGGTGYVGLRIANGPSYYYGVATVTYDAGTVSLTVSDFAFQSVLDTGISANAVAVPEPSTTAALVAAMALGVAVFRRRRAMRA